MNSPLQTCEVTTNVKSSVLFFFTNVYVCMAKELPL